MSDATRPLTIGVQEACQLLRISPDALMRKARRGIVPGAKVGREWVFIEADLLALIREQAKARASRCAPLLGTRLARSPANSVEAKLDEALKLVGRSGAIQSSVRLSKAK